jgi:cell division ATPase FtsA
LKENNVLLIDIGAGYSDVTLMIEGEKDYNGGVTTKTKTQITKRHRWNIQKY